MGYYTVYDADGFFGRTEDRMEAVKMAWARWRHWYLPPAEGQMQADTMMSDLTAVFYVEDDGRTEIDWNADLKELFWVDICFEMVYTDSIRNGRNAT